MFFLEKLVIALIVSVSLFWYWIDFYSDYVLTNYWRSDASELVYDFIVVGSGSAGAVVMNRLSNVPHYKVLLLEAGGNPLLMTDFPLLAPINQKTPIDWQFKTEPQKYSAFGLKENVSQWPRGKCLGGTSNLNYMMYIRGNKKDYDKWEKLGNPGWSYKECLPFFRKSENQIGSFKNDEKYHGIGGYTTVEDTACTMGFCKVVDELGKAEHFVTKDPNGETQEGFSSTVQSSTVRGRRSSTYKGFIRSALERDNLRVEKYATVEKILFSKSKPRRAVGVVFWQHGKRKVVRAKKEIIISAGAIGSPHILLLSGIGPKEQLKKHKIPLIADLAVGENLQDHVCARIGPYTVNRTLLQTKDVYLGPSALWEMMMESKGPFTSIGGVEGNVFFSTRYQQDKQWPDIQAIFHATILSLEKHFHINNVNFDAEKEDTFWKPLEDARSGLHIMTMVMRPKSRGTVSLRSRNYLDPPIIDPNYYSDPDDLARTVDALMKIHHLYMLSEPVVSRGIRLHPVPVPGCEAHPIASLNYMKCFTQHRTFTVYHPVGTCSMGPKSDPGAVVDNVLRVHGIRGLRVADASIMPRLVTGNTNAPAIMIGERASAFIKDYWNLQRAVCHQLERLHPLFKNKCYQLVPS